MKRRSASMCTRPTRASDAPKSMNLKAFSIYALSDPDVVATIEQLTDGMLVTMWVDGLLGMRSRSEARLLRFDFDAEAIILKPLITRGANKEVFRLVSDLERLGLDGDGASPLTPRLSNQLNGQPILRASSMSLVFRTGVIDLTLASPRELARVARFFSMAKNGEIVYDARPAAVISEPASEELRRSSFASTLPSLCFAHGSSSQSDSDGASADLATAAPSFEGNDDPFSDDEQDLDCSWHGAAPVADENASLEAIQRKIDVYTSALSKGNAPPDKLAVVDPVPRRRLSVRRFSERGAPCESN